MKYLLCLALFASLALVPTSRAVAAPADAPEQALCGDINLSLTWDGFPLGTHWTLIVYHATGPYMIWFGHSANIPYKGCTIASSGTFQFGPYTGNLVQHFDVSSYDDMIGVWQCISATQTSLPTHIYG